MTALDDIRARATAYIEHGTPGLHAPQDRARLLAAFEAVEKIADDMDRIANLAADMLGGRQPSMSISLHAHADKIRVALAEALGDQS